MATTAIIEDDSPQNDGRRWVRIRYDTGTGKVWRKTPRLGAGVDAQVHANSTIPREDDIQKQVEREAAYGVAIKGGDPDLGTYYFNTLAEIQKYVFRKLFNLMRDEELDAAKSIVCGVMGEPTSYLNKHNANAIAGFIDDPAWNNPTTNAASNKISAVGVNIAQLDHGEDELSLEF